VSQQQTRFSRGDVIAKKYEIERFLGDGMISATYLARHINSGKELVIKFVRQNLVSSPKDQERLRRLFERARSVRHDLLTRYGELGLHDDFVYITEEYFPSESLRDVIKNNLVEKKFFTLHEACQIAISVLQAAEVGHQAGLIHRNIKPENVLVNTRKTGPAANPKIVREIKVSGLGISGIVGGTLFTEGFMSRGEVPYLAPELSGFDQDGGPQADVYSVGVMLYELLCGQRPMGTYLSPTQLRDDLPEHLDDIVEIALAHNAEDRYPTPRDMINDIQRSFSLEMAGSSKTSFRTFLIGLGVAIVGVVAVGGYFLFGQTPDPMALARDEDAALRRKIQTENPLPAEADIQSIVQKAPGMVYVPGGTFIEGRLKYERADVVAAGEPLEKVIKVEPYFIDRYEFPNRPNGKPATRTTWPDAEKTCNDQGKRLCTAAEWEKACKGPANFVYAYGDDFNVETCGSDVSEPYSMGARTKCISGYGVMDMSGGVREWTGTAGKDGRYMVKGGLRGSAPRGTRCAFEVDEAQGNAEATLGFRCCLDGTGSLVKDADAPVPTDAPPADAPAATPPAKTP